MTFFIKKQIYTFFINILPISYFLTYLHSIPIYKNVHYITSNYLVNSLKNLQC